MTTPVDAAMMNPVELFMTADWVVKSVMIGLAAASIWSWTIIIDKAVRFTALNKRADEFEKSVQSGRSLEEVASQAGPDPDHALPRMLVIALSDWREARQRGALNEHQGELLLVRIDKAMNSLISREGQRIENGLGVLSVVATASPFIGLFGTVWGIMNAFIGISEAHTTNLAVVAPGIAEALLATALGLVAAIPAVVIYNHLTRSIAGYRALLGDASVMVMLLVSREGDRSLFRLARAAE